LAGGARTGLACFPSDGRSPEELLAHACERVSDGRPAEAGPVVVEDPATKRLWELAGRVARSSISVLVLGETGVGKELIAEEIHRRSPRADKPLLRLNCAAIAESLLESELFGHEKGAFTGADRAKPGLLESADGGTVFLDEVGELPAAVQVKLLRVLEDRQVLRVGAVRPRPIDVRFVAATNRDLEAAVAAGAFRSDLFYRLCGITLMVPPLRDRPAEIEPLARALLAQAAASSGRSVPAVSAEALVRLRGYGWPGNIRELRNFMERAALLCGAGPVLAEHLPIEKMSVLLPVAPANRAAAARPGGDLRGETDDLEHRRILEALEQSGGNQKKAAQLLGIPRSTLLRRLEQFDIPRPRKG
jgi:transcriptional regulator with PAS, ATPase and Fis domain